MKIKSIVITVFGILLSILLIYITFSNTDPNKLIQIFLTIKLWGILLFPILTFFEILFRSIKWYLILKVFADIEFIRVFRFEVIALGINNILPFRMGEILKVLLVSKYYKTSKTTVASTVIIERLIDTIMLFVIFISYSLLGGINVDFVDKKTAMYVITFILLFIYTFFIYSDKVFEKKFFKNFEKNYPGFHSFITKIKTGGLCFKKPMTSTLIFLTGLIQWNFDVAINYIIAKALSIEIIDFPRSAITVVAGSLSASIPSMPGYFGNYEFAISRLCMIWGIEKNMAVIFPTIIHILSYTIITIACVFFIYYERIDIKKLIQRR